MNITIIRTAMIIPVIGMMIALSSCSESADKQAQTQPIDAHAVWLNSMKAKNHVKLDRLDQTELQTACSNPDDDAGGRLESLHAKAVASVVYPENGDFLGDWESGEAIAQNGKGMQWTDNPDEPNGGNCYACHQLDPEVIAYGTIGPSLKNYSARGQSEDMLKYTWAKIWNPHASVVCSHMPRFGDAGILTPDQIRDVMALLFDPESPVNRK